MYCLPWVYPTGLEGALSKSHTVVKVISSSFSHCPFSSGELKSHVDTERETRIKNDQDMYRANLRQPRTAAIHCRIFPGRTDAPE